MEIPTILTGVAKKDSKYLFTAKIEQELEEIKSEIERLDTESQKYENIIAILDKLPQELGWSIPYLPITRHAFVPAAMLTNTNEIQVHIGDGWFTRCSAHHAKGICRRRQEKCGATKTKLEERREMLQEWLRVAKGQAGISGGHQDREEETDDDDQVVLPSDAFSASEVNELVTEEQYLAEQAAHKEKARAHYLKERERIKNMQESIPDSDIWTHLEELELEEESQGELRGMKVEVVPKEKQQNVLKLGWSWDDGSESTSSSSSSSEGANAKDEEEKIERPRKLSFADHIKTESDATCVIEFTHTPTTELPVSSSKQTEILQSPSDIYTTFQELFSPANTQPKSILKRRSDDLMPVQATAEEYFSASEEVQPESPSPPPPIINEVLLDIVERNVGKPCSKVTPTRTSSKKKSKFKSSRK